MSEKLLQMPSDDELALYFIQAANEGAHDSIKSVIGQLTKFLENAKAEIKKILHFDPQQWVLLHLTLATGNEALDGMISAQNFMLKGILRGILMTVADGSFQGFIAKMKTKTDDSVPVTIATATKMLRLFLEKIWEKYVVGSSSEDVEMMVKQLFA